MSNQVKINKSGRKAILATYIWFLIQALVYYLSVGSVNSFRGLIYFVAAFILTVINSAYMIIVLPGLTNERGDFKDDSKAIDKLYLSLFILVPIFILPLVCGLEFRVNESYYFGNVLMFVAVVVYFLANAFNLYAMSVNRHFEGTVRIQTDRDHKVISTGPYGIVRHPGYISMIMGVLVVPFMLGSLFGIVPALITVLVIVKRTKYEDDLLKTELEGYKEYANITKYRLIPWIW